MFAGILEEPRSQVVSSQQEWATFSCRVKGEDLQWYINDKPPTTGSYDPLIAAGAEFTKTPRVDGKLNSTVTLPTDISYGFNSTRLGCIAYNSSNGLRSANAVMTIAGIHIICHSCPLVYAPTCVQCRSPSTSISTTGYIKCH